MVGEASTMAAISVGCSSWNWAVEWFGDAVCEPRDKAGFIIGLVSVVLWAMAEVPQLVVNAMEQSSEGLSEGLLWLWVFSDVLDVVGCSISDTLPTMLITAWMYFIFTVLLLFQHIYYTRFGPSEVITTQVDTEQPLLSPDHDDDLVAELDDTPSARHRHRHTSSGSGRHTVYGSLRNLSIHRTSSSSSLSFSDAGRRIHDSWVHRRHNRHRAWAPAVLAGPERPPTADAATIRSLRTGALPGAFTSASTAGRMAAGLALVAVAALGSNAADSRGSSANSGASLLDDSNTPHQGQFLGITYAVWGAVMGWTMAVTFFLGRVPQVFKNWRRKSCAGLSVEMFVVVLSAAVTYCASILIRERSWSDLLPKLPFFTDAAVGAVLDLVILVQFFMYKNADDELSDTASKPRCIRDEQLNAIMPASAIRQHSGSSSGTSGRGGTSPTRLADVPLEKLAALNCILNPPDSDTQVQHDSTIAAGVDRDLGHVLGNGAYGDTADDSSRHVDILVLEHPGQPAADLLSSSSWNEDALSLLSAATV